MKPYRHQILEGIVDGELKLALVEIIDEILAQDTACTKMNQGEKLVTSDSQISAVETGWSAHSMAHRDIPDDIFQLDKNSLSTAIPTTDRHGQLLRPAARNQQSGSATNTDGYLESDEIKRNEQLNISTGTHFHEIAAGNSETAPDRSTVSSQQFTYKTIAPEQNSINSDRTIPGKLDNEVTAPENSINIQNNKTFLKPDQERKLILILTKMFDAEFRKGHFPFNQVARSVLQLLGEKFGSNVARQISIEHLQGAYIGMSARYRDLGATRACDVIAIKNKSELEDPNITNENESTYFKNVTQDAKIVYLMGEGSIQHKQHGSNEIGRRGTRSTEGAPEKNDPQTNTGALNILSGATGNNVYPLSSSTSFSEMPIESGSATSAEVSATGEFTANPTLHNSPEIDSVEQQQELARIQESLPDLIEVTQAKNFHPEKNFAGILNYGTETNELPDTSDNHGIRYADTTMAMEGNFAIADDVHRTLDQPVGTPAPPAENTAHNEPDSTTAAQNQAFNQLLLTNTLIPFDKASAAHTRIKSKLESHTIKPDPELLIDGATLTVAFIEAGIREYNAYLQIMIDNFGYKIEPYLRDFYEGACYYLGLDCPKEFPTGQIRGGAR